MTPMTPMSGCVVCASAEGLDHPARSDVEKAFVAGLALGFNLRSETTFLEVCRLHTPWLEAALTSAGSHRAEVPRPAGKA